MRAITSAQVCCPASVRDKSERISAAITAAELGAKVALIGHGTIGGTCVNVGCVPSKALIRAAEAVHGRRAAARFPGLDGSVQLEDWSALAASKNALVGELRQKKYADLLPAYEGVSYIEGKMHFDGAALMVDDAPMKAGKIILAMGARANVPPIPGLEAVPFLTSTTALALERLPKSLLVIGGGMIAWNWARCLPGWGCRSPSAAAAACCPNSMKN